MTKSKKRKFDIKKIIEKNPAIDKNELAANLEILKDLQKLGIKTGPNYNLSSPFIKSEPTSNKTEVMGSSLREI